MEQEPYTSTPPEETPAAPPQGGMPILPGENAPTPPRGTFASQAGGASPPKDYAPPGDAPLPAAPAYDYNYGYAYLPHKPKRRTSPLHIALLAVATALFVLVALLLSALLFIGGQLSGLSRPVAYNSAAPAGTFSVVRVVGDIVKQSGDALGISEPSYHHADTLQHIRDLAENDGNAGILLYMNTPGGGVYESDELYLALMDYKEATGRPVWAYMADICASGGYYVCAAASRIAANRNSMTGSIGVYIALTDTAELYDMLGIETLLVKSGENKGVGMSGVPITEEQRAVYQGIVDEGYNAFVEILAEGRGMDEDEVRALADGRVYTARQAEENGLVDELGNWEDFLAAFEEETGAAPFYPNFSRRTPLGGMLGGIFGQLPENETQTKLSMAQRYPVGVPMMLYDPAVVA